MKIIKRYIYIIVPLLFLSSCLEKKAKTNDEPYIEKNLGTQNTKEVKFKHWMRDTIKLLKTEHNNFLTTYISNDSLSLDIHRNYKLYINPIKKDTIENNDVVGVLNMLEHDRLLPRENFELNFEILHFYDLFTNDYIYEHNYEIKNLELIYSNKKYHYKYIKGNLIDVKTTDL